MLIATTLMNGFSDLSCCVGAGSPGLRPATPPPHIPPRRPCSPHHAQRRDQRPARNAYRSTASARSLQPAIALSDVARIRQAAAAVCRAVLDLIWAYFSAAPVRA